MTLFKPIMARAPNPQQARLPPSEPSFVKTNRILLSGKQVGEFTPGCFTPNNEIAEAIICSERAVTESIETLATGNLLN
ncbi:hypothetical protein N657DRAFT_689135 [Parathielavia appendiculata]|uniref:Uncharacterized protein n=1 Tax=Parathielavia appendiculata TaxID=2587402 RepID=A0AAN6Z5A8_9PEZI|nr:hypothetical protein N657DRAFT_689135 [Parathielavia appendiculata]